MTCKIEKNDLVIRIPLNNDPPRSSSGKSLVIATTSGFKSTDCKFKGQSVSVSLNAIIKG